MSAIGYPDFRRQQDYDQSPAFFAGTLAGTGTTAFGPYYVGNFQYLALWILADVIQLGISVQWYLDQAGTQIAGTRTFYMEDFTGPGNVVARFTNLGRYAKVTVIPAGGGAFSTPARIFASNRPTASELIAQTPVLLASTFAAIPVGGTQIKNFTSYFSGFITISAIALAQNGTFYIQALTGAGVYTNIANFPVAGGASTMFQMILPTTHCRAVVQNGGGVPADYLYTITPNTSSG